MAEFCLDCWNKLNGTRHPKWRYVLSEELDFCEECCQWKPVIVRARFVRVGQALYVLGRILMIPWLLWRAWREHLDDCA